MNRKNTNYTDLEKYKETKRQQQKRKRERTGSGKYGRKPWSQEEIELLMTYDGFDRNLALKLGRSLEAIYSQRRKQRALKKELLKETRTMDEYHIALTGYSPPKLTTYQPYNIHQDFYRNMYKMLKSYLEDIAGKYKNVYCYSGMALGADIIWSIAITETKKQYPNVHLIACIPDENQANIWSQEDKMRWEEQTKKALKIVNLSHYYKNLHYSVLLQKRNEYMVDNCNELLAIYDETSTGGTKNTIDYAKKQNKPVTQLNPKIFK